LAGRRWRRRQCTPLAGHALTGGLAGARPLLSFYLPFAWRRHVASAIAGRRKLGAAAGPLAGM